MSELLLRGWTVSAHPEAAVAAVLPPPVERTRVPAPAGRWWVPQPIGPDEPVGLPATLVELALAGGGVVECVPGSQGSPRPPESVVPVRVELAEGGALVLDARCWLRVPDRSADVGLWRQVPR